MSTTKIFVYVHGKIQNEFFESFGSTPVFQTPIVIASEIESLAADASIDWIKENTYLIFVLPGNWAHNPNCLNDICKQRIAKGTARVIFWATEADHEATLESPMTCIPLSASRATAAMIRNHMSRFPGWGLQTVIPNDGQILIERISNEKQVAKKIEQSVEFVSQQNANFKNRTLGFRSALTTCFATALSTSLADRIAKPPVFQLGVGGNSVAFSLRWKSITQDYRVWQKPDFAWKAVFHECSASFVQLNAESQEIEVILLFTIQAQEIERSMRGAPTVIDILTSERLRTAHGLPNEPDTFKFEYFQVADKNEEATKFVTVAAEPDKTGWAHSVVPTPVLIEEAAPEAAKEKETDVLELKGLRVEYSKLEKQFKGLQDQMKETTRKMNQALESDRESQIRIKSLQSQLETLRVTATKQSQQEIGALKLRLENSKQKEMELVKKLSQALDIIKQLKSSNQQAG